MSRGDRQKPEVFAQEYARMLQASGVSGSELCRRCGFNTSNDSRYRRGLQLPAEEHIRRMATVSGYPAERLLRAAGYAAGHASDGGEAVEAIYRRLHLSVPEPLRPTFLRAVEDLAQRFREVPSAMDNPAR